MTMSRCAPKLCGLVICLSMGFAVVDAVSEEQEPVPPRPPGPPLLLRFESNLPEARDGLTQTDIPKNLPLDLKEAIEKTFSANPVTRQEAAKTLGRMRERAISAIPFLIRLLSDEEQTEFNRTIGMYDTVNQSAYDALSTIGKPAVEPSIAALKNSTGEKRLKLVLVLGGLKDPRAIGPLAGLLRNPNPDVRLCVVISLIGWAEPRFVPPLIDAMKDKDNEVRRHVTWALRRFRDPRVVPPLIEALKDKEECVRLGAAEALGNQGDRRATSALLEVLQGGAEDARVRREAAYALGMIAEPQSLASLLAVLKDRTTPEFVRRGAAEGLAASKEHRFVQPLSAFVKDRHEASNVRAEAVRAVAAIDGEQGIPFLMKIATTQGEDDHVRCCAAMCVVKMTKGAIDDVGVVTGLEGRYGTQQSITAIVETAEVKEKAVAEVAEHGKTETVRVAAMALLAKWKRGYTPPDAQRAEHGDDGRTRGNNKQ